MVMKETKLKTKILRVWPELNINERIIVLFRTGLAEQINPRKSQIGKILGLSRERIRQINLKLREKYPFYAENDRAGLWFRSSKKLWRS